MDCHAWYVTSVNGVQKGAWLTCCHTYFRSTPRTDYSYLELSLDKQRVRDSGIFEIARLQCTCCLGEKFHVNIKKNQAHDVWIVNSALSVGPTATWNYYKYNFRGLFFFEISPFSGNGKKLRNNRKENKTNFGNQTAAKFASEKQSSLLLSSHSFHFYLD